MFVKACMDARISTKAAIAVCRSINRLKFARAKALIEDLLAQKKDINGKYYTKASDAVYKLLKALEANAKFKGIEPGNAKLNISAHKGPTFRRARRKRRFGTKLKNTRLQAVLIVGESHDRKEIHKGEHKAG